MEIQVFGNKIDLGEALTAHVLNNLGQGVAKYSENPVDAQVIFSKDRHEFLCDVTVHLSTGMKTKARGKGNDIYGSADDAVERMEKQLRRYKRRLKNHHKERKDPIQSSPENSYVIEAGQDDSVSTNTEFQPVIIAETQTSVQTLSVGEAVMQMELTGENMLVFRNSKHGGVNVVHMREDGNIGWIDPRRN